MAGYLNLSVISDSPFVIPDLFRNLFLFSPAITMAGLVGCLSQKPTRGLTFHFIYELFHADFFNSSQVLDIYRVIELLKHF